MRIVLASSSPRRHELLAGLGYDFEVIPSTGEEVHDSVMIPSQLCELNAAIKARAVAGEASAAVVIGADTLVFLDGEPLGKPRDLEQAREMLARLSGRSHAVITGVCMIMPDGREECFHETTKVFFKDYDDAVITDYLERVNPMDKAGSYGIQEHGEMLVEKIEGSYENVMGLPVGELAERLRACSIG